jgi:carboxyl-terminal processing protease
MPRSRSLARALGACLVVALPVLGPVACDGGDGADPTGPTTTTPTTSLGPKAAGYLDTAVRFTQEVFYYGNRVDWTAVRAKAFQTAAGAQTAAATYPAIREMIQGLGDPHSFFYEPSESLGNRDDPDLPYFKPVALTATPRHAYLWLPTFGGISSSARADSIQRTVAKADSNAALCGWIIDLRGNPGGFWPAMLAGLSPLITPGRVGGFVERDTTYRYFYEVRPGFAGLFDRSDNRSYTYLQLPSSYQISSAHQSLPVAILQGANTASAGEIIVMAFKEPNRAVRTFGKPTYGVTSQPYTYTMSDKASIQVTSALMFDRQLRTYYNSTAGSGPIAPDEDVTGPSIPYRTYVPGTNLAGDQVVQAAVSWLDRQPACASRPSGDQEPARARLTPGGTFRSTVPMPGDLPRSAWPKPWTPWSASAPASTTLH